MKATSSGFWVRMPTLIVSCGLLLSNVTASQLVSQPDTELGTLSHANGDSGPSIITPDGRYVLFSSAANNLTLTVNSNPIPVLIPARINVYLRDRTNDDHSGQRKLIRHRRRQWRFLRHRNFQQRPVCLV